MPSKSRKGAPGARAKKPAAPAPSESSATSRGSSSLSPAKSAQSLEVDDESVIGNLLGGYESSSEMEMEGDMDLSGINPDTTGMELDGVAAEEDEENGDNDDDEEDDDEGGEDEGEGEGEDGDDADNGDDGDDGDDGEDGEEDEDEDEDDNDEDEDDDDAETQSDKQKGSYGYPAAVADLTKVAEDHQRFKTARFMACTLAGCECPGLVPPAGSDIAVIDAQEAIESPEIVRRWKKCGNCGHGWEGTQGHVLPSGLGPEERTRRVKVVGRIEELLQDEGSLTIFPAPQIEDVVSLIKQLHPFQRPTGGKKPASALPPPLDMSRDSSTPFTPREDVGTPIDSDEERPRKRSRHSQSVDAEDRTGGDEPLSPRQGGKSGKKPGGKTAGKGTKPRTVVRGVRGLIPMETDAEGNQHVAGRLPDSAIDAAAEEDEDEEEDVPLAQRPQLDEGERRRREVIKEKEREREDEVLRRLAKGSNVEDGAEGLGRADPGLDVEVWEGVELPKLPARPAMIEQQKQEIMLPVVGSRNPTPVATILLIGLKNLFQRQLPKMPREYITRLVLDKNHISMAIVKRGWRVVGGICYRPFESRGFAEIVFCAVDSSEQIKGYGSHLMNSLKDHVRKAHPTINHFLTYADNYAVGYFKKQGFTKEISLDRSKWVGYIKDYEGGTIMQCTMLPVVRYMEVHQMLADQKAAVLAKIRTISRSHVVRSGLKVFRDRKEGQEIKLTKADVPGLAESGWNPEIDEILRQPRRNPDHVLLQHVLNDMQNESSAWPFTKPVDKNVVVDYYDVITEPMDLSTMEYKLENNHYGNMEDFMRDAQLMFNNCRQYNGSNSTYSVQANNLEKALDRILKARMSGE